jgi:predicted transcriptional regulator
MKSQIPESSLFTIKRERERRYNTVIKKKKKVNWLVKRNTGFLMQVRMLTEKYK